MDNVRLNKANRYAIALARFAHDCGIDMYDAAVLAMLADKAFHAGERACNEGSEQARSAEKETGEQFDSAAIKLGLETDWPGLWPLVRKNGRDIMIPDYTE